MYKAKEWLREKTQAMTLFVHRFSNTASRSRKTPADISRQEAIHRIQQMDLAIDVIEADCLKTRKEALISAVSCAARAAILCDLATLDIKSVQMLMDSIVSRNFMTAAVHLDRIMDGASFAGGYIEHEEKVVRLCEERQRREQVSFD